MYIPATTLCLSPKKIITKGDFMITKRIVCLGLSYKHGKICVAGRELNNASKWIRPVFDYNTRCIPFDRCVCTNNKKLELLDIVDVTVTQHCPSGCHFEDYIVAPDKPFVYIGKYYGSLDELVEYPQLLWNSDDSSFYGINDRVNTKLSDTLYNFSICFIKLDKLTVLVNYEGSNGNKKVRGDFTFKGTHYRFAITDISFLNDYKQNKCGIYCLEGPIYAGISLSEDFNGYRYKLIASIMKPL